MANLTEMLPPHAKVQVEMQNMLAGMSVGAKLPPENSLAKRFRVSRPTLRKALKAIARDGTLETRCGSGTFLRQPVKAPLRFRKLTKTFVAIMPTVAESSIARIVEGIERQARTAGYRMILSHDHGDPEVQLQQLEQIAEDQQDGLIIYPDANNVQRSEFTQLLEKLSHRGIPFVLVDRYIPGIEAPYVITDHVHGMYALTRHMILNGFRRPAILKFGPEAGVADRDRLKGFSDAMRDAGLSPKPIKEASIGAGDYWVKSRQIVSQWIKESGQFLLFDSILGFQDSMAYGAFQALKDAGLRVPEDIALAGYGGDASDGFAGHGLELTIAHQPFREIGETAVKLLVERIQSREESPRGRHVLLRPRLVIRTSCGSVLPAVADRSEPNDNNQIGKKISNGDKG
jgi:DNA-binding LacI/PurR family transcriptional regulator